MHSIIPIIIILTIAISYWLIEFYKHQKHIYSIPIRIHINGTRGKSSITRLVGAGLRAGNIKTYTKVTGTYPRLILEDGSESMIYRRGGANIIEQKHIVKFAADNQAQALIIECMALDPTFQWITENQMIHATISVISNVRPDHLEIMGPTVIDVGKALSNTIPKNGVLFTSEKQHYKLLKDVCDKRKSQIVLSEESDITEDIMNKFDYIEHKENVALALDICAHLGVNREIALHGMYKAIPDEGVLRYYKINEINTAITLFNALAANDPQSSLMIWEKLKSDGRLSGNKGILINTRADRLDRAKQLVEMTAEFLINEIEYLFLIGESCQFVERIAIDNKIPRNKIFNIGLVDPQDVYKQIVNVCSGISTIVAVGNMGSIGAPTIEYFKEQSIKNNIETIENNLRHL